MAPLFEAEQVDVPEDEELPELPEPGSAAYRKIILKIAATSDSEDYQLAMRPVFTQRGWRAAIDVMVEIVGNLGINCPPWAIDAFGKVKLDSVVHLMSEEDVLEFAARNAKKDPDDRPYHEALRSYLETGDRVASLTRELLPVWEEAATVLRRETRASLEEARVLFTRWLNTHRDDRVKTGALGASITHAVFRKLAMPPGDAWVDELVATKPDLRGSVAWARNAPHALEVNHTYALAATYGDVELPEQRRKKSRCKCGRKHRR